LIDFVAANAQIVASMQQIAGAVTHHPSVKLATIATLKTAYGAMLI
jgi:hypothetical protein